MRRIVTHFVSRTEFGRRLEQSATAVRPQFATLGYLYRRPARGPFSHLPICASRTRKLLWASRARLVSTLTASPRFPPPQILKLVNLHTKSTPTPLSKPTVSTNLITLTLSNCRHHHCTSDCTRTISLFSFSHCSTAFYLVFWAISFVDIPGPSFHQIPGFA